MAHDSNTYLSRRDFCIRFLIIDLVRMIAAMVCLADLSLCG